MYQVPEVPSVVYLMGDTSNIDIDAGPMGSFRIRGTATSTLGVAFARSEGGVQVTATFQELNARRTQPMGGAETATEADIEGDVVFTLDPRGRATVISMPETRGNAGQLANPEALPYDLFPRLPGGPVAPGESWIDTIRYELEEGGANTESVAVVTYTLQGDTVVDGTSLLHITMAGTADVTGIEVTQGMEVSQTASGEVSGTILWDPARGLVVYGSFHREMDGTVEVPAAGMPPMPMSVTGRSHMRLQGG